MKATHGKIWEACSKNEARPVLTHVSFDAEAATLVATNSYIAARVACEVEEGDESGLIPAAAIKEAAGRSLRVAKGKATLAYENGEERSWPVLGPETMFPKFDELRGEKSDLRIGLNPDLFRQLGVALGGGGKSNVPLVIHPRAALRAMRVENSQGEGILMPVRASESSNGARPAFEVLADDGSLLAAIDAAVAKISARRGRKAALAAFRKSIAEAAGSAA